MASVDVPSKTVASRTAEDVIREREAREKERQRALDLSEQAAYQARLSEDERTRADLRNEIKEAIPLALKRLARKRWKGGVLRKVFTWDGSFIVVKRKRNPTDRFARKMEQANYKNLGELAAWNVGKGEYREKDLNFCVMSNGHLARFYYLVIESGRLYDGVESAHPRDRHVEGLLDDVAVTDEAIMKLSEAHLRRLLGAIRAL